MRRRGRLRRAGWLYRRALAAHFRSMLEYHADFWVMVVAAVLTQLLGLVFISAIFTRVPSLAGWSFWDLVALQAMITISEGVGSVLFNGVWLLSQRIHQGELDYLILRPYPVILQVLSSHVGMNGFGNLLVGGILLGLSFQHGGMEANVVTLTLGALVLAAAVLVKTAISVATNAASFWLAGSTTQFALAVHQMGELGRFPLSVYFSPLKIILTTVLPFAFVSYFPISFLLQRPGWWIGALTPLVALVACAVAVLIFRAGLRRYEGSGH